MNTTAPNSPQFLTLLGGGGHALVVAEAALAAGYTITGFYDDNPHAALAEKFHLAHLGPLSAAARATTPIALSLGDLAARRAILDRLASQPGPRVRWATIIHPSAYLAPSAQLAVGVFVGPRAIVQSFALIEPHAILNTACIVEHECRVGENTHLAPGTILAGRVTVGRDSLLGIGSRVLPNLTIGDDCTIGAGSVVITSLGNRATAVGAPARILTREQR